MNACTVADKSGKALADQRFQMLGDIAKELSGEVTFPTCFDVAMQLRRALNDPNHSMEQIGRVIQGDPLICSKLVGLANSVAYNPGGTEIRDIKSAVQRLGLNAVRSVTMAVAMKQMLLSKEMVEFKDSTTSLWDHSIMTASASHILAQKTRFRGDDARLAGLVHDIGAFYMLYRASRYDELRARPDSLRYLVIQWHESIGESLLNALGMPEKISVAIRDHDYPRPRPAALTSLGDIVYVANALVGGIRSCFFQDMPSEQDQEYFRDTYLALQDEIQADAEEMRSVFA